MIEPELHGKLLDRFQGYSLNAFSAAKEFAIRAFDEPREVLDLLGDWQHGGFDGTFRLRDGVAKYRLVYSKDWWKVFRVADGSLES